MVIDSNLSFAEAISGTTAPPDVLGKLSLVDVEYVSFDGRLHRGQLLLHRTLASEVKQLFCFIKEIRFPIGKVIPIVHYGWSDEASMADNNTSSFNYRFIASSPRLSLHAFGLAIDINPRQNPVIYEDGRVLPRGASYNPREAGTIAQNSPLLRAFTELHWTWGGTFYPYKDYHHFEKIIFSENDLSEIPHREGKDQSGKPPLR